MAHQASLRQQAASTGRGVLMGMNAWDRHKHFIANYVKFYGGQPPADDNQTVKTDWDVLRENYRFIREEGDDAPGGWEVQLAQKYYRKLFREYAVADLSRYKEGKLGLRWRMEKEVVSGKGQFACGARGCNQHSSLASFEVNFVYEEAGAAKAALVKLRLCPKHALQLNFQKNRLALQAQQKSASKRVRKQEPTCKKSKKKRKPERRSRSPIAINTSKRQTSGRKSPDLDNGGPSADKLAVDVESDAALFRDMFK